MTNTHSLDLESGSSQYAYIADNASLSITGSFTIECWVNFESLPASGHHSTFVSKLDDNTGNTRSYIFFLLNSAGTYYLRTIISADGTYAAGNDCKIAWTPKLGVWYYVASVFDSANTDILEYVNGVQLGSTFGTTASSIYNSANAFMIGAHDYTTPTNFFDGKIDEIRLWNDVRTPTEILNNYGTELVGNEANLVGYWKFNNNALDETSNNNDLTLSGSPAYSTTIPFINNVKILYATADGYINSDAPTTNYGTVDGGYDGKLGTNVARTLYKWDFSLIPSTAGVTTAILSEYTVAQYGANARTHRVYRVLRAWTEAGATWNKYDGTSDWGTAGCSNTTNDREASEIGSVAVGASPADGAEQQMSLTASAVEDWINGTLANNGLLLKADTENDDLLGWKTRENANISVRPQIRIEYTTVIESNSERSAKVTGKATANSERSAKLTGAGVSDERNAKTHGIADTNSEKQAKLSGGLNVNSERQANIHGGDSANSERDAKIHGIANTNSERSAKLFGTAELRISRTYRILVKDENGDLLGEFDKFRDLKFGKRLNNYGTASFEVPLNDTKANTLVGLRKYTVWIYYQKDADTTLVWAGEQAAREANLDDKGNNWCIIHCFTWLEQLNSRYTDSERIFTDTDAGEIAWTLIDETQTQSNGDFGITEGSIETTINRDRSFYNQNVMEGIVNLANVLSGFDFEITDLKVFNVYQVMGSDKSEDIVLEYGHNVKRVKVVEDFTKPVNRAIVIGESTGDAYTDPDLVRVERDDATSQTSYKVREGLMSEMDVSEQDTMEEKGDALLRKYGSSLVKVDIDLASVQSPNITEFNLGDSIRLVIDNGIYDINEQFRVFEWGIEFDSNDVEKLSLVLGNFTYE